jgi:fatty-acyl-CoA synthase
MGGLRTLRQALEDAARTDTGITFLAGRRETRRSYEDLLTSALSVAGSLRDRGLRRGDLVAVVLPDPEPFLTALFGASIAGLVPASVYPPATTVDLPHYFEVTAGLLREAGARAVVTTAALASGFESLRASCPELGLVLVLDTLDGPALDNHVPPALDDLAFVQFTSGSTSAPKGVALTHRNLAANVEAVRVAAGLVPGTSDVALSWLPLYHDMGLVGMTFGAVYSKRPAVLMTPQAFVKRPADWLRAISRYRASISFAPTFAYDLCLRRVKESDLDGIDLSCWRLAGCGAEPIHAPTLAAFAAKLAPVGFRAGCLLPSYGLAEHVVAAAFAPRGRPPRVERIAAEDLTDGSEASIVEDESAPAVDVVSCGHALPGHRIKVVSQDGRQLPERQVGEIVLAGPSVMLGYYRQEALTAQTIRDGWLHTGDLGYISDGELFVCGRVKDMIIVNGRKYHPQDLEWAVDTLAGVRRGRVVAFGVSQIGRADRVVLVVEPKGTITSSALTDSIRRRISDLFGLYVDEVALVPAGAVGRTTSGKIQRASTKAQYERGQLPDVPGDSGLTMANG